MTCDIPGDGVLHRELRALRRADGVTSVRRLEGGGIAEAWLVTYAGGTRVAGNTLTGTPAGVFETEADGLAALRVTGNLPPSSGGPQTRTCQVRIATVATR